EVATGVGWAVHPDSTDAAGVTFVEGPATPPLGRGSLELYAPTSTDRALAFAVPTGAGGGIVPTPVPWAGTTASYATFVPDGGGDSSAPTLRIVGYQVFVGTEGFTTLSFQPPADEFEAGVWQTWDIGPGSEVFQSNTPVDNFCIQADPCTLEEFGAHYPGGRWGEIQVGIGAGAPAESLGYADAVVVRGVIDDAQAEFAYDFELPASDNSTASVAAGAATATGGSATVTLNASAISATPTVPFTIVVTLPDGTEQSQVVEVDYDSTQAVSIPVPFGTTHVEVWAQDTLIAEGDVTFTAPVTPPVTPPGGGELAPTGFDPVPAYWGSALLAAGLAMVAVGRVRVRARGTDRRDS
ncbi:hypothetical protein, partial [Microbacterium sp. P5_E9]